MRETLIKLRIQIEILVELGTNRDSDDDIYKCTVDSSSKK